MPVNMVFLLNGIDILPSTSYVNPQTWRHCFEAIGQHLPGFVKFFQWHLRQTSEETQRAGSSHDQAGSDLLSPVPATAGHTGITPDNFTLRRI
jgi:hypothetical protein